jgi:uncharacterized protein (TIGR01370 family)
MDFRHKGLLVVVMLSLSFTGSSSVRMPWVAYYSDQARPEEFRGYKLVIFDGDRHPPLAPVAAAGTVVLAYLSLGEIEQHRTWFPAIQEMGILAGENRNWPGSYYVDLRDPRWPREVIGKLVPALLAQGFQGLFLDTLDDPVELERCDPRRFRGLTAAAAQLVQDLRRAFPSMTLMMNRGYGLLPAVARHIDIALGESICGTYDFGLKVYRRVPAAENQEQVRLLKQAKHSNPALRICSLDYWDPADREGIRRIYREERANGFDPYVATIGLDQIVKEPR